jgi:hypothetical protein
MNVSRWLGRVGLMFAIVTFAGGARSEGPSNEAPPASFAELLVGFEKTQGLEARFEEEKILALLAAPLRSSGRLFFTPPSTLLRRVEEPRRQDILVRGGQVRMTDESGVQVIDLDSQGGVRPLVESMIWIFTGDLDSLERTYQIDYRVADDEENKGQRWEVRLAPKAAPLSQLVEELRVSGQGRTADTMELVETSGDRTRTRILAPDLERKFDAAERRALFGLP